MADSKSDYSDASKDYVASAAGETISDGDKKFYERSRIRFARHGDNWTRQSVNINDVVETFTPSAKGTRAGVKFIFYGERYNVVADMASGYLRIYDTVIGHYVDLDGKYHGKNNDDYTHFRILRKEEM